MIFNPILFTHFADTSIILPQSVKICQFFYFCMKKQTETFQSVRTTCISQFRERSQVSIQFKRVFWSSSKSLIKALEVQIERTKSRTRPGEYFFSRK